MKAKLIIVLSLLIVGASCKKTTVTLTSEEQLTHDVGLIDEYLASKGIVAINHSSGLRYVVYTLGTGPKPNAGNCVRIKYSGRELYEDTPFDSNDNLGFALKKFIFGWQIGLKELPQGSTFTLYIPSGLGYGPAGSASAGIGRNAILVFDMEFLGIGRYDAPGDYCTEWQ